jgi:amino acid transporter
MATQTTNGASIIKSESRKLKRELTLLPLAGLIYFTVCGGSFGIEPLIGWSGPGLAILLIILTPLIFSLPNVLMVRELTTMMPAEGGYYHWVKQAFGPFAGFMAGWNNWVVSWLDVAIYPVFAAYYLSFFIPALSEGATIAGVEVPGNFLSWIVAIIIIWGISWMQVRGARLSGLFTNWISIFIIIPLAMLTLVGLYAWYRSGVTPHLPFIPNGESLIGALSTGLFVVMWNYMGWELPAAAGDEIVNPRRTYPRAMALVLVLTVATYLMPVLAGLYGGAGADGMHQVWGIEAGEEGIGPVLEEYGVTPEQMAAWDVDPTSDIGWEFPQIGYQVGVSLGNKALGVTMGSLLTIAALLSMIGLFVGNSLGGTRVPFALAEDGMFPRFLVRVHNKYGTPWVAIVLTGVIYSIFSLNAFAFLVVADVFLQLLVILAEFAAMWKLRYSMPDVPRKKVPWGVPGMILVTLGPVVIIFLAIYSQVAEEGFSSIGIALLLMALGAILYFPIRKYLKPGVPDVDPFEASEEMA